MYYKNHKYLLLYLGNSSTKKKLLRVQADIRLWTKHNKLNWCVVKAIIEK